LWGWGSGGRCLAGGKTVESAASLDLGMKGGTDLVLVPGSLFFGRDRGGAYLTAVVKLIVTA